MMPTRLQDRALIAKIIGVPIPPAPTIPESMQSEQLIQNDIK